jgi:heme A synthase
MEVDRGPAPASEGYSGAAVAGAVLATLFFPFIALIAALLLQGSQTDPRKRAQLRTWAWASVGLLVLDLLLVLLTVGVFATSSSGSVDRSGPCQGGPKIGATGTQVPGKPHKFVFPCVFGGTETTRMP